MVPDANDLRSKSMTLHHVTPFPGHCAQDKTVHQCAVHLTELLVALYDQRRG